MNCKEARKEITSFIDEKLSAAKLAEFNAHIKSCKACAAELKKTQSAVAKATALQEKPLPAGFMKGLSAKLDRAEAEKRAYGLNVWLRAGAAGFAVIVAVVAVKTLMDSTSRKVLQPTVQELQVNEPIKEQETTLKEEKMVVDARAKPVQKAKAAARKADMDEAAMMPAEPAADAAVMGNVQDSYGYGGAGSNASIMQVEESQAESKNLGVAKYAAVEEENNKKVESKLAFSPGTESTNKAAVKSAAAPAASAPQAAAKDGAVAPPKVSELKGYNCAVAEPGYYVFKSRDEYTAFMAAAGVDGYPGLTVNYYEENVAAVFAGEKPTAGYSITIVSAINSGGITTITYSEQTPGPGAMTAQVITYPYHIKVIPKVAGKVVFIKK